MIAIARADNVIATPQKSNDLPLDCVLCGDSLDVLARFPDNSIDAIVCDPPAGINFMGKDFDKDRGGRNQWVAWLAQIMTEALRVTKPGGHAFVWALPRTSHWTATALEDAGWEIRDIITHLFGSGFPKSMAVDRAIDKYLGKEQEREVVGPKMRPDGKRMIDARPNGFDGSHEGWDRPWKHDREAVERQASITAPATPEAQQWKGYGTALKPAVEIWWKVRKPLTTVPGDEIIARTNILLEALLWSLSPVNLVELSSRLNPHGLHEAKSSSVRWFVNVLNMLKSPELSDLMDTFNSPEAASTYLSIAWLWNGILDALCSNTSKYTTSTITSLITDLKTLNSWISAITPENIVSLAQDGLWLPVITAENNSSERSLSWKHIPTPSVVASATLPIMRLIASTLASCAELLSLPIPMNSVVSVLPSAPTDTTSAKPDRPASEHWILCRKPLSEKSIAENVLKWGCGGLAIDACRVGLEGVEHHETPGSGAIGTANGIYHSSKEPINRKQIERAEQGLNPRYDPQGRFPSNLLLSHSVWCVAQGVKRVPSNRWGKGNERHGKDGSSLFFGEHAEHTGNGYEDPDGMETVEAWDCSPDCPVRAIGEQSGERGVSGSAKNGRPAIGNSYDCNSTVYGSGIGRIQGTLHNDTGTAARYFQNFPPDIEVPYLYCSKASRRERNQGCEGLPEREVERVSGIGGPKVIRCPEHGTSFKSGDTHYTCGCPFVYEGGSYSRINAIQNSHPTVKPLHLMRWLIRLITPPGGIVLDCFAGSGSTAVAAIREGVHFILVEQDTSYVQICEARIAHALQEVR